MVNKVKRSNEIEDAWISPDILAAMNGAQVDFTKNILPLEEESSQTAEE